MKRAVAAALVLVAVTACGPNEDAGPVEPDQGHSYGTVEVFAVNVDGREVTCLETSFSHGAGLSCDWESAR